MFILLLIFFLMPNFYIQVEMQWHFSKICPSLVSNSQTNKKTNKTKNEGVFEFKKIL